MNTLTVVLWVLSGVLALFGGFVILINYACWYFSYTERRHHSMIPLIGALALGLGMLFCPILPVRMWAWLPFVLDPSCLLMLLLYLLLRHREGTQKPH